MRAWMEVVSSAEMTYSATVEVEHPGRLGSEVGVAGEDPGPVLPGLDRVRTEPAPDGGARDRGDDARLDGGAGQVGALPAGQRRVRLRRQFAGQRLDSDHDVRGKNSGAVLPEADRSGRPGARRRSVCATWRPPARCIQAGRDFVVA